MTELTDRERRIREIAFEQGWDAAQAFNRPEIRHALELAWDEGFTECAQQHMKQERDPSHYLTRENPYIREDA